MQCYRQGVATMVVVVVVVVVVVTTKEFILASLCLI
jgi:hypothetical protein